MDRYNSLVSVIVVAAGMGKRMLSCTKKQFMLLGDRPILYYSLVCFEQSEYVKEIVLVVSKGDVAYCKDLVCRYNITKVASVVEGGITRQESVYRGLCRVCDDVGLVMVHDGVRPFVGCTNLRELIVAADMCGCATFGVSPKDTIKIKNDSMEIEETLDRSKLVIIQTPQAFVKDKLVVAHEVAIRDGYCGTDDTVLLERCGIITKVVEGSNYNIKITTPDDLVLAGVIKEKLNL